MLFRSELEVILPMLGVHTVKLEWVWGGGHLEGIYCIIQSIIAVVCA